MEYRALAIDSSGNISLPSASLFIRTAMQPSYLADSLKAVLIESQKVQITWVPGADLEFVSVLRAEGSLPMITIKSLSASDKLFEDKEIKAGAAYRYVLRLVGKNSEVFSKDMFIQVPEKK
jgi:hypothetical protein